MDGLTLRDKVASSPDKTTCKGAARARKGTGGDGARTEYVVSRTGEGRDIAAVPLLKGVVTYLSHKSETKGPSPRRSAA